jgi:hypothetical protein
MLVLILLIVALVLFILAGLGVAHPRLNLTALGLAAWVATVIIGTLP